MKLETALHASLALTLICAPGSAVGRSPDRLPRPTTRPPASRAVARNPIIARNFPDPAPLRWRGPQAGYYLVGTAGSPARNREPLFEVLHSRRLEPGGWRRAGALFPAGRWPRWAIRDFWAPELHLVGRKLVAYYTARDETGRLCIGAATASSVKGPFVDLGRPLVRDSRTGAIDSHYFRDRDGKHYLVWKLDGNDLRPPQPTPIYLQELGLDGLSLRGSPRVMITNDRPWEGPLVEGPWLVHHNNFYYLFYSGNGYATDKYAVGVARARSLEGPWEKAPEPILRSNRTWAGPGHGGVVHADGRDWFVYHAWQAGRIGDPNPRMVLRDSISWRDGWPRIGDGTPSP